MKTLDVVLLFLVGTAFGYFLGNIFGKKNNPPNNDLMNMNLVMAHDHPKSNEKSSLLNNEKMEIKKEKENKKYFFVQDCGRYGGKVNSASHFIFQQSNWTYFKEKVLKNNKIFDAVDGDSKKLDLQGWSRVYGFINGLIEDVIKDTNDNVIRFF